MRRALSLVILLTLATDLAAQSPPTRFRLNLGVHLPLGITRRTPICDGSEMASVRSRRSLGNVLFVGGLGAIVLSPTLASGGNASSSVNIAEVGLLASGVGLYLHYNSSPSESFWQNAVPQIKVGESRAEEVRQCFGSPNGTIASGNEATWTYHASSTGFLGLGGSARSLSITLKDGLVTKVQKSEFGF